MKIMSMRRLGAALFAPAVVAGAIAAAPSAQAANNSSQDAAAAWLADQPDASTHLFVSYYADENGNAQSFTDYGLNLDISTALSELGDTTAATALYEATLEHADEYIDAFGTRYAGSVAKLAVAVQDRGDDPTQVGKRDLIEQLTELVVPSDQPEAGRANDAPDSDFQSSNTITQGFATRALATAGNDLADEVSGYLLKQQCDDGSFRLLMDATQCTTADGSVDATAFAVKALQVAAAEGQTGLQDDIDDAASWLVDTQAANGSFSDQGTANTNSTGLAAAALASTGHPAEAREAAEWVIGQQLTIADEAGAIAPNAADFAMATSDKAISTIDRDKFVRATVQAALGLVALLPDKTITVTGAPRFAEVGAKLTVFAGGFTPGEKVRFATRGLPDVQRTANATGRVTATFVPTASGLRGITVVGSTPGRAGSTATTVLGARTLRPTVKYASVRSGKSQQVSVTGLASGEPVKVGYAGRVVVTGNAAADGTFSTYFKVGTSTGRQSVSVVGAFTTRRGLTSFTVK